MESSGPEIFQMIELMYVYLVRLTIAAVLSRNLNVQRFKYRTVVKCRTGIAAAAKG